MLNCVLSYVLLLITAGSVFSHTVPIPHEKPLGWQQPVVISEEFFPPQSSSHHPSYPPPHREFKEIIGIELQRIPYHGSPEREILEREKHKEHEFLEHRKHEILGHAQEPHIPPEILEHERQEHEILSHELPPHDLLEPKFVDFDHHSPGFQDVLEHDQREHEHREHEIMVHEQDQEHEILEHEHREHDILAHGHSHDLHHPPWEDPDFVLNEEEHHYEHDHEYPHEELFPEISRRRSNRRREGGARRSNSNSNRGENSNGGRNSNRRENSNRQGNNRRENTNREGSRRREGGSNINTEELFPRRNRQNNNRRNSNTNNRRNNNNREGSRRNSNIEELTALEEEITNHEISRPERDVNSYYNDNRRETSIHESSPSRKSESNDQTLGYSSSRPTNTKFETKKLSDQQGFVPGESILSSHERRFATENFRRPSGRVEQQGPSISNANKGYSNTDFELTSNLNEYSSSSNNRRPDRPSSNIFVSEEHSGFGGINSQRPISRPTGSNYNNNNNNNNNNEQDWNQQGVPTGSNQPISSNTFTLNRPEEFSNGENPRPSFLGSRPVSGKPTVPGSLSGQNNTRPNRPNSNLSGFHASEDNVFNRPNSGSSGGSYQNQESRPSRPGNQISGLHSFQEERPSHFGIGSMGSYSNQENLGRPSSGFSGFHSNEGERPSQPGAGYSEHYVGFTERPSGTSFGLLSNQGNLRPNRPLISSQEHRPHEHGSHEQSSRPHISISRPYEENSKPTNGNNLNNESDLISVQEDSWLWPNQSQDEDKQNRRALYSGGNKKQSTTTKKPNITGIGSKKQHINLKLLPTDSCGVDLGNKIIGGENTQLDEFPWMALLQHSSADGRAFGFGCGGSLISQRYVLTAAHCIKGQAIGNNVRVTKVRLGEFDTSSDVDCQGDICSPSPVDVAVEEIIVHPKYRATDRAQLNDIALIRLKENIKNSAYVSPICLPIYGNKNLVGEKLTVAGWGKTSNGQNGASSKIKQKVSVPVVTLEECSPFYNRINIQLNNTQMCAGGENGKDSCQGDSGGPLMGSEIIDSQIRWQVYGVVSFGPEDCGIENVAGVYTKVSDYIDWILDNMKR